MLVRDFVFQTLPTPSCHASTLAETTLAGTLPGTTQRGMVASWFGGAEEGARDVGIWLAHRMNEGAGWTKPERVAYSGEVPCWNPVLHQLKAGPLLLFYRMGPSPQTWTAYLRRSMDGGKSWSAPEMLPAGVQGPVKNKPHELPNGTLLCPSSTESHDCWGGWVDISPDGGRSWTKHGPIQVPGRFDLIQPTLVQDGSTVVALARTRGLKHVARAVSRDQGRTWGHASLVDLPHPGSGIDAVRLADGRVVLVYNHTASGRSPLNLAVSGDLGQTWTPGPVLESEPGEYSYPAIIQAADGSIHITYTWKRQKVRYVRLLPGDLPQPV